MSKKRTRKQKEHAQKERVNSQIDYKFNTTYNFEAKEKKAILSEKNNNLGSIKKELFKSLGVALLILISLVVLYWFS
jgi:hypothetical protein